LGGRDSKQAEVLIALMTPRKATLAPACVVALGLAAAPQAALAQGTDASSKVQVATTGDKSELVDRLPITKRAARTPRVVMSLTPQKMPSLATGDQLEVNAEVEVTTDCRHQTSECVLEPYEFNPKVGAKIVIADRPDAGSGFELAPRTEIICRQKIPDRQHHCMMVLAPPPLQVDLAALPCSPQNCHVNLVLDSYHRRGSVKRNVLLVGANNRNGRIVQDKGRLNVIRTTPGNPPTVPPPPPVGTAEVGNADRLTTGLTLDPPGEAVIYSQQLDGLRDGEQLAVQAGVTTDVTFLAHNANVSSKVVLADDPFSTVPGVVGSQVARLDGEITENNGFNCTHKTTPCPTLKRGVAEIRRDADIPLYVNVVLNIGRIGGEPSGSLLPVTEVGGVTVTRYPADQKG
jgi:hypothetical protein